MHTKNLQSSWRFIFLILTLFICSCSTTMIKPIPANDLNPKLKSGALVQKTNNFEVILDTSVSMRDSHGWTYVDTGQVRDSICAIPHVIQTTKLEYAQYLTRLFNDTIPNLRLEAGLRDFAGQLWLTRPMDTKLLYGVTPWVKDDFGKAINKVNIGGVGSPLNLALDAATKDLKSLAGYSSVIIFTDGLEMPTALSSATIMRATLKDKVCIYAVQIGNDPSGTELLRHVVKASQCGFMVTGEQVSTSAGMADFVEKIFLGPAAAAAAAAVPAPAAVIPPKVMDKLFNNFSWNVWAEEYEAESYNPSSSLQKGTKYNVVLDLSAFQYKIKGIDYYGPSVGLMNDIGEALKIMRKRANFDLVAVIIPDTTYFNNPNSADQRKILRINLNKMRGMRPLDYNILKPDHMHKDIRKRKEKSNFVFGHVAFPLTTKEKEDCNDGWATVAIVLFRNNRPVDEIKTAFCVGTCDEKARPKSFSGLISGYELGLLSEDSSVPDGSITFLELEEDRMYGVFCDTSSKSIRKDYCVSWQNRTQEELKNSIHNISEELGNHFSEEDLRRTGKTIMQSIFGNENTSQYKTFKQFVRKKKADSEKSGTIPSLFARVVTSGNKVSPFIPLGLLLITADNDEEEEFFLGQYFKVVTPLPVHQSYSNKTLCIPEAVAFLPPATTGDASLKYVNDGLAGISASNPAMHWTTYRDISEIKKFIGKKDKDKKEPSTALFILSHHHQNKMYFDNSSKYITAGDFLLKFNRPSAAILNACDTSVPDASNFVIQLNAIGIDAIIATSTKVHGYMAGRFHYCLHKVIKEHKDKAKEKKNSIPPYTVSQMFYDAVINCLWDSPNEAGRMKFAFEANALKYILLGNGDLKLCTD